MRRYPSSRADAPTRPSSSAMTAKIRSVDASGRWLALLCPGPSPNSPPAAMANQPWMIWYPVVEAWGHGSSQPWTRLLAWPMTLRARNDPNANRPAPEPEVVGPPGRHPQHPDEQGEEQERRPQVVFGEEDEQGQAPGGQDRAPDSGDRGPGTGRPGGWPWLRRSARSTITEAKKMARASLAISPGWKLNEPTWIHRRAPLMSSPMPGTSGSSSSTMPTKARL